MALLFQLNLLCVLYSQVAIPAVLDVVSAGTIILVVAAMLSMKTCDVPFIVNPRLFLIPLSSVVC